MPPHLAGREQEQAELLEFLAALGANEAPLCDIVVQGPRGNGKTVLLRWFGQQCRTAQIDSVWLTPTAIADLDALATELVPPSR